MCAEYALAADNVAAAMEPYIDLDGDNVATLVQAANTNLYGYVVVNTNGTASYVQLFNAAAAVDVTVGTTVPDDFIYVPASGAADAFCAVPINNFPLGLVVACTTTVSGSTDPSTGLIVKLLVK